MSVVPVYRHGCEIEDTGCDGDDGDKVVDGAVDVAKDPVAPGHVHVVEDGVEYGHQEIRETHVDDESVGYGPHVAVSCNQREKE